MKDAHSLWSLFAGLLLGAAGIAVFDLIGRTEAETALRHTQFSLVSARSQLEQAHKEVTTLRQDQQKAHSPAEEDATIHQVTVHSLEESVSDLEAANMKLQRERRALESQLAEAKKEVEQSSARLGATLADVARWKTQAEENYVIAEHNRSVAEAHADQARQRAARPPQVTYQEVPVTHRIEVTYPTPGTPGAPLDRFELESALHHHRMVQSTNRWFSQQ